MKPAVSLKGVGKKYRVYQSRQHRLREILSFGKNSHSRDFWAVEDVSFDVEPGTTMGIIGRNGAGKSTLLKIISSVLQPTSGTVEVNGRLAALFGVGAGFNPEFTGRENIMLNGLLLGIERREMLERFDDIEAFADLGEFLDRPIKTYSSGMQARLGFAVAINVSPDILVVDETLSVGDAVFKQMCLQRLRNLRDSGTTILFVSHSLGLIKNFCEKSVLLHQGHMLFSGGTAEAIDRYEALISNIKSQKNVQTTSQDEGLLYEIQHEEEQDVPEELVFKEDPTLEGRKAQGFRHGTGEARIQNVEILNNQQRPVENVESGSTITIRVHLQYLKDIEDSVLNVTLRNKTGTDIFSTSTTREGTSLGVRKEGERVVVDFTFAAPLRPDNYNVNASVAYPQNRKGYLDWVDVAAAFKMLRAENQGPIRGLIDLSALVEVHDMDHEIHDRSA